MTEFTTENVYFFTGSTDLIERKKEVVVDIQNQPLLGKFIKYIDVAYHGEFYEKGKAEFEFGTVNFPYFNKIEKEKEKTKCSLCV